ncbi:hypothetical protein HHI36_012352 [Cryptolaemus montrouzieri]|uniref:Methyltransferase-like protein n=1 Tax=Cryptolaemus montrouzieri TaxID=559131 RepID=A0ABD2NER8_9CUCU
MENTETSNEPKILNDSDKFKLEQQNLRLVPEFKANQLEVNAKKYWDLFYKRNETRFFKDRHWTTREFTELLNEDNPEKRMIFEVGCGVGNFIFPLINENLNFFIYACDLSPRAVDLVKRNPLYNTEKIEVFQCDITTETVFEKIQRDEILFILLKPGGCLLFRDYGLHDMAQIRFKAGHKISDNFYMRQDGTRSYYFSTEIMEDLFIKAGFEIASNCYIHRRTINKKENVDVPRIFLQSKVMKPR